MANKIKAAVQNRYFLGVSAALTSGVASAADADIAGAINSAITAGQANVSMTMVGVITLAAVCFGGVLILSWLKK